jgi:ribonucleoside-diphosphate reductase alpha chain
MRGAVNEGSAGGQNSGDAGGSHAAEVTTAPFAMTGAPSPIVSAPAAKREYTAAEKTACSIEAMRNGEACEACQ